MGATIDRQAQRPDKADQRSEEIEQAEFSFDSTTIPEFFLVVKGRLFTTVVADADCGSTS